VQPIIDGAFQRLAGEENLRVAPVSAAWHRVLGEAPGITLYEEDGSHAAPAGSYLAACVFFGLFTGRSPEGQPERIEAGGNLLADLDKTTAQILQNAAWKAVSDSWPGTRAYPARATRGPPQVEERHNDI
jgi:hypothetical protein